MRADEVNCTCGACPSQWEFVTNGDLRATARYRHGWLSVRVWESGRSESTEIYAEKLGDSMSGVLDWSAVEDRIRDIDLEATLKLLRQPVRPVVFVKKDSDDAT